MWIRLALLVIDIISRDRVLMFVGVACLWLTGLNEVDYSLYPERSLQLQWLRAYLEAYKEYKDQGTEVSEAEVEVLYVQVNRFALVSVNEPHHDS